MAASVRLLKIFEKIQNFPSFDNIWDLCCDHGYFGQLFLKNGALSKIHFVDIRQHIISHLRNDLIKKFPVDYENSRYFLNAIDASDISLSAHESHAVVIAGVGGELAQSIMSKLHDSDQIGENLFVICAHYHMRELRSFLAKVGLKLHSQELIFDGKWPYEILVVSTKGENEIIPFDESIFDMNDKRHISYYNKIKKHYAFAKKPL